MSRRHFGRSALCVLAFSFLGIDSAVSLENPADFGEDVRTLYRVVACATPSGGHTLDAALQAAVDAHCKWLTGVLESYRKDYLSQATPFFAKVRPKDLPSRVVYPFGGGDMLSALATFPDAAEITTLSLEHEGDPRRIHGISPARLAKSLEELQRRIKGLFTYAESTSENMMRMQKGDIAGQLAFTLVGFAAHGYEPVGLRFFRIEPDGSLHYFTAQEIEKESPGKAQRLNSYWVAPDFAPVFSNAEFTFRRAADPPSAPLRVHRHIAANLANASLAKDGPVLRFLQAQGRVAAMTKAASYLLWGSDFSRIRDYLLTNMTFMVSDSTGIPASDAKKAGFEIETYGKFTAPFLPARKSVGDEFVKLWAAPPYRELTFRYGYPDATRNHHLMILRPAPPSPAAR